MKTGKMHVRTFLFGSLISTFTMLVLIGCGFLTDSSTTSSYTVQSANKRPPTSEIHGIVNPLHMIDAHIGWTQSWYTTGDSIHNDILRTTDGGVHWRVMFTCSPVSSDGGKAAEFVTCNSDFRSSMLASVIEPQANNQTRIYHTSDGGQTWLGSSLDARAFNQSSPVFVDGLHGWFFGTDTFPGRDPGSSYIGQNIVLFRTNDGGETWNKIVSGPAISQLPVTSDDAYGTQPPFTANARMTFLNTTTGWIIGTTSHANDTTPWLYVTHDAGTTWHKVALTFPTQASVFWTPQFFDANNGLLPMMVSGPAPAYIHQTSIYTTYDAGTTWKQSAFVPFDVSNAVFRTMMSATADAEDGNKVFYTTIDGWQHWTKHTATTPFAALYGFTFVSQTLGWAIGENPRGVGVPEPGGGRRAGDIMSIQHTTDGGRTWHEISHSKV